MIECPDCGQHAKSVQGLMLHRRAKHPDTTNVAALETTLRVLDGSGRLEPVDAARVQTLRSLARAVDVWPSEAQLWRQYREALSEVLDADDSANDSLERALADIRGAT